MRDLVVLGFMFALVPLALRHTFVAYLLWGWAGLIGLVDYLYGFMQGIAYAQWFAIAALVGLLLKRDKEQPPFQVSLTVVLFICFAVQCIVTASFAYAGLSRNWEIGVDLLKTLLFCSLMPMLVTSRWRLHAFLVMVGLGLGFHGLLDGLKFIASGGGHIARGLPKFGDNNNTAAAIATSIPILLYLARYSVNKWAKTGFIGVMVLAVLAVIASRSRGGFATLLVMAAWMIWHTKRKLGGLALLGVCLALALALAPAEWTERMDTIQDAQADNSFMTRVAAWKKSSAIALEHPFTGGGFYAVQSPALYEKYHAAQGLLGFIDTPNAYNYAAHSIYFQVMGDTGFIGLFIYLALFVNAFHVRRKILKLFTQQGATLQWAADLANTLGYSMVVFLVAGSLLSTAYFDIPFILIALMQATWQVLSVKGVPAKTAPTTINPAPLFKRRRHA